MPVNYNVDRMISSVKRRAGTPDTQTLYQNEDFVAFLNEAMFGEIVPAILRTNEEFFVAIEDLSIVANQNNYPIPTKAFQNKLRSVELVDPNDADNFVMIPRSDIESISSGSHGSLNSTVFYIQGNDIILFPTPKNSPTNTVLRLKYFRRPNELVPLNCGAIVNAVDLGTFTLSMSNVPTEWSVGDAIDVVRHGSPFDVVAEAIVIQSITSLEVVFLSGDLDNVSVNDTAALEGFSITPNIAMSEAHRLLEQATIVRLLEGIDDSDGIQIAQALFEKQLSNFLSALTPRVDSAPKKIVPRRSRRNRNFRSGF